MVAEHDGSLEARPPTLSDLVALCRRLNEAGARYAVIGGMAVIQAGFVRATEDIDLLIDAAPDNVQRVRRALVQLPDAAARDLADDDLDRYTVVRVADEIVVDLLRLACGVSYAEAESEVEHVVIDEVSIPFATPELLWRTKQTMRDKDVLDRTFLARLLGKQGQ